MLYPIIKRVAADTGISLTQDRAILLDLYNAATKIFHFELEANRMYREVTFVVPPDKLISLPSYVGEVQGLRVHSTEMIVPLTALNVPRYTNSTLLYKIKNWRDLGDSPVQCNLELVGPLTITCPSTETTPVTLKIAGQTPDAARIEENVVVDSTNVTTLNSFGPQIFSIACFDERNSDLTISDANGNVLATLGNNEQKTRYKIMDVSQIFWPMNDTVDGNSFIDVCYKLPFVPGKNDTDSFSGGDDYDEAIYHMMMHLHWLPQGGKQQEAVAALGRATLLLKSVKDGTEEGIHKKLNWGRNKFYGLFTRGRHRLSGNDYGMYFNDVSN